MSKKYNVIVETISKLVLDTAYEYNNLLIVGDKRVVGRSLPTIGGNNFAYDKVNRYRFGCGTGLFNYDTLLKTIAEAEAKVTVSQVDGLKPKKGGNNVTKPVIEETPTYYIVEGGKTYLKANYDKTKIDVTPKEAPFGNFKWQKDTYYYDAQYYYKDHVAGSKKDILDAMYKAKAIIDFLEDKGDYALVVEDKVEEVVVESN